MRYIINCFKVYLYSVIIFFLSQVPVVTYCSWKSHSSQWRILGAELSHCVKMDRISALLNSEPCPPEYEKFLSKGGKRLHPVELRQVLLKDLEREKAGKRLISMSNGLPNVDGFPIVGTDIHLRDGSVLHIGEEQMNTASNYGLSEGYTPLREWLLELHKQEHKPPQLTRPNHPEDFHLVMTAGAFEGLRHENTTKENQCGLGT
ncbi:kynurenine/alpha-aminoadipate aminotransferase, mitochondrial-like [Aplysia californica]|uniref:Kynurenine/alpha-aminoadipate aminotransferase, mitochondrial-like n=1 Tax=Aplysia californica TaxID=6500 RepID=A0ABM0JZN0_APLCA|nr:kynurenine/alpha-aminoadipate aminotransferase, mitochondrial-like [Aplysia californica]